MNLREYRNILKHEQEHFFYVSTNYLIDLLVKKYTLARNLRILDVGCGTGNLARKLASFGKVRAIDYSLQAVKLAKEQMKVKAKIGGIEKIPFLARSFDLVTCIDVLVHDAVKNKQNAIGELARVTKSGGFLIMRVAANQWLLNSHDRFVQSSVRFSKNDLVKLLENSGFEIKKISSVHSLLFVPMLLKVVFEKIFGSKSHSVIGRVDRRLNAVLTYLLKKEAQLILRYSLPLGTGLIVVARKR